MKMIGLTEEEFKEALPEGMRKSVNPLLVMKINNTLSSPDEWEMFKENLLDTSYIGVLKSGKFKMEQYINAVRYVSYKVMGLTNKAAYERTFPEKIKRFELDGVSAKDVASYTTAYNKSKLVNLLFEQTLVPSYILNAPYFQEALNVQVEIMYNQDNSAKVRSEAANSLLTHLKQPETKKIELDIAPMQNSIIDDMEYMMHRMVAEQKRLIEAGADVKAVANAQVVLPILGEVIDV